MNLVSRSEWLEKRKALLLKEKQMSRDQETLAEQRRALPLVKIDTDYLFRSTRGELTLAQLFGDCSQLIVYHFMFGTDWVEGCPSCSFWADNYNGVECHLKARDTQLVAVANAPLEKLQEYRDRLGWGFEFVSTQGSSFGADFGVNFYADDQTEHPQGYNYGGKARGEELPGISVFVRLPNGIVAHSYSAYGRGLDALNGAYHMLDLTPKGRDEADLPYTMAWLKRNDEY
jgi:predicted dithiol-disulfide oxidoreductase (DUF899 family)